MLDIELMDGLEIQEWMSVMDGAREEGSPLVLGYRPAY